MKLSKRLKYKIIPIGFLLIALLEIPFILFFYFNPQIIIINQEYETTRYISNKTKREIEMEKLSNVEKKPKDIKDLQISGWIPDWDINDGLISVQNRESVFDSISPVWFYVNKDGSLKGTYYTNNRVFIDYCKNKNIELIPAISLFDADVLNSVVNKPANMQRHIDQILTRVTKYKYDGIDLDYESTYIKDKKLFLEFLQKLADELHKKDKKLIFTAVSKWGDELDYSMPQTRKVQDYAEIAKIADEFRIMTYEYVSRTAKEVGPIAPLEWMEQVIQYTIKAGVPREKIMLGIHTYAYDYSNRPIFDGNIMNHEELAELYGSNLPAAEAYYNESVEKVKRDYNLKVKFHDEWGEAIGQYKYQGKNRIVIFPNNKSIELRKQLAAEYGLKGIVYWRVGDEGELGL